MQAAASHDADEIGVRLPAATPVAALGAGETGYLIAGIKDVAEARSGETVTEAARPAAEALQGYRDPKPMVFCGLYPIDGDDYARLRESLERARGSTTPASPTSPRPPVPWASASAAASWACCTWRSSESASSASSTSA